ncbi:MAG: hypothetical protein GTO22_26665 [Gemmatimonadales bacterium]|nr:hypothetical protein [Gemmatimonadales bacterium]
MGEWAIAVMVMNSVFILSGAGVLGYWLKLRHERRHLPKIAEQLEVMREAVGALRDQLESQTAELHERLDFAERVLTRGGDRHDEASPSTPV